jgi:hypothetical protein
VKTQDYIMSVYCFLSREKSPICIKIKKQRVDWMHQIATKELVDKHIGRLNEYQGQEVPLKLVFGTAIYYHLVNLVNGSTPRFKEIDPQRYNYLVQCRQA